MIHDSTNFRGTGKARPKLVVDITPENLTMPYFWTTWSASSPPYLHE